MKTFNNFNSGAALCVAASLAVVVAGCGGGGGSKLASSSTSTSNNYLGTQAPGDVWDWTLGNGTFSAANNTKGTTYSGTSTLLPSGFYQLGITASSDSTTIGQSDYAFEIPGVAMIAQPVGANSAPIVGAALGTAPPAGTTQYNWVSIPSSTWTTASEAFGTVALSNANGTVGCAITKFLLDGTPDGSATDSFNVSNGQVTNADGSTNGVFTPAGVVILDLGPGHGGVVGVEQPSANVDLADLTNNRQFRGILFKGGNASQLIWAQSNGSGALTGGSYTNVATNSEDNTPSDEVTLSFTGQPSPGEVQGTITSNGASTPIAFSVSKAGGKYVIFGFAIDSGAPYNFLAIEK